MTAWMYRHQGSLYYLYRNGAFIGQVTDEHAAKRLIACANACECIVDVKAIPEMIDCLGNAAGVLESGEAYDEAMALLARAEGRA